MGLMDCAHRIENAIFGIVAFMLFKSGSEYIDKRLKIAAIFDAIMVVLSVLGFYLYEYGSFNGNTAQSVGIIVLFLSGIVLAFIFIYTAIIFMGFSKKENLSRISKGWMAVMILLIVFMAAQEIGNEQNFVNMLFNNPNKRVIEISIRIITAILFIIFLVVSAVLFNKMSVMVEEDEASASALKDNTPFEQAEHDYKRRAIFAAVSVIFVLLLQSAVRYICAYSALDNTEKIVSRRISIGEIEPYTDGLGVTGHLAAKDWPGVSSFQDFADISDKATFYPFVIETDSNNIEPISKAEFVDLTTSKSWARYGFLYGDGELLNSLKWTMRDYKITLADGEFVYATYPSRLIDQLGEGKVRLPIAVLYYGSNEVVLYDFSDSKHVTPLVDREDWMKEMPIIGSYNDKFEYENQYVKSSQFYFYFLMILATVALVANARFFNRDIRWR